MPRDEMAAAIESLVSAQEAARHSAATLLYRAGVELSQSVAQSWCSHVELAAQLLRNPLASAPEFLGVTVGVAVRPPKFHLIRAAWDSPPLADVPPDQDALEFELHAGGGAALDILTTGDPGGSGAIARFLARNGEGIQQVEYVVRNVTRACSLVRDLLAISPIYTSPRPGAGGTMINFFLTTNPDGKRVLIELVQPPVNV